MYTYDHTQRSFTHVEHGKVAPSARNSHTLTQGEKYAYLFGGADNENGPKRDLYRLDLETLEFNVIKLEVPDTIKLPYLEMHTAHLTGNKLLILGGRGYYPG